MTLLAGIVGAIVGVLLLARWALGWLEGRLQRDLTEQEHHPWQR
jgi:uncharacterized membrane protein YeaQ/YmgE (transglycosylase-associated protein family)